MIVAMLKRSTLVWFMASQTLAYLIIWVFLGKQPRPILILILNAIQISKTTWKIVFALLKTKAMSKHFITDVAICQISTLEISLFGHLLNGRQLIVRFKAQQLIFLKSRAPFSAMARWWGSTTIRP